MAASSLSPPRHQSRGGSCRAAWLRSRVRSVPGESGCARRRRRRGAFGFHWARASPPVFGVRARLRAVLGSACIAPS
eukprot:6090167-Pyramimonas_sp.AAC.1